MQNESELDGKYLGTISKDFIMVSDNLKEVSYQIRSRKISEYPIFPIQKSGIPKIGKLLLEKGDMSTLWNYNASFFDEFLQRELIAKNKKLDFIAAYKNPDEFCCLFVIDKDFTRFVFIPYPVD